MEFDDKEYLEELITRVLEQHEVTEKEDADQMSSCVLPLVTKILEYIDEPESNEATVFVFQPIETFDPNELLEPREEETTSKVTTVIKELLETCEEETGSEEQVIEELLWSHEEETQSKKQVVEELLEPCEEETTSKVTVIEDREETREETQEETREETREITPLERFTTWIKNKWEQIYK